MKKLFLIFSLFCLTATISFAQNANLKIELKDGSKPDVYIDGKKYDHAILDLLDQDKIATVDVIKGEKAKEEYNAPNGVVVIRTKSALNQEGVTFRKKDGSGDESGDPMIIIDGKTSSKQALKELSPDDIATINVYKDDMALKKYNAPNGVISVVTKKGAKN